MADEKRQERRIPIDSVVLPFIGSRAEDYQPFQYLLQDVSLGGVRIAVPQWAVSREHLRKGERIHFHIPFRLGSSVLESGYVAWEEWDTPQNAQIVGAFLDQAAPVHYPVFITLFSSRFAIDLAGFKSPSSIFCQVLKDSLFLKQGVLIYLKHLTAYFSRSGEFKKGEYDFLREALLDDVKNQVQANAARLERWRSEYLAQDLPSEDAIPELDMEELREAMEPELYLDLFRSALGVGNAKMYLLAIKELEKRLFYNYNTMVMLFIQTLRIH
ncbi:MAG: hypothetical protein QG552_2862 [Thermodesulfobacteriota bacterium]|nr:hypothetical protein [Thermodesulfobacteriota bacterium]